MLASMTAGRLAASIAIMTDSGINRADGMGNGIRCRRSITVLPLPMTPLFEARHLQLL